MATRRRYTSKRKKQTLISPKSFKWILGLFLLICTIVFVYQKKDVFLYYLGFKYKHATLTANQRKLEDARINDCKSFYQEIVDNLPNLKHLLNNPRLVKYKN